MKHAGPSSSVGPPAPVRRPLLVTGRRPSAGPSWRSRGVFPDLAPLLVAVASILGGVAAILRGLPKLRRLFRVDETELAKELRLIADAREEQVVIVRAELDHERQAHLSTKTELDDERLAGARCRRELAATQSDLRLLERQTGQTASAEA